MFDLSTLRFINIVKLERIRVAMAAQYFIFFIFFRLFGLPANTESADVIRAAVRNENMIEISKADRAIILVNISFLPVLIVVA